MGVGVGSGLGVRVRVRVRPRVRVRARLRVRVRVREPLLTMKAEMPNMSRRVSTCIVAVVEVSSK